MFRVLQEHLDAMAKVRTAGTRKEIIEKLREQGLDVTAVGRSASQGQGGRFGAIADASRWLVVHLGREADLPV